MEPGQGNHRHVRSLRLRYFSESKHPTNCTALESSHPYNIWTARLGSSARQYSTISSSQSPSLVIEPPSPFAPSPNHGYLTHDAVKRMREDTRVWEILADEFEQLLKDR